MSVVGELVAEAGHAARQPVAAVDAVQDGEQQIVRPIARPQRGGQAERRVRDGRRAAGRAVAARAVLRDRAVSPARCWSVVGRRRREAARDRRLQRRAQGRVEAGEIGGDRLHVVVGQPGEVPHDGAHRAERHAVRRALAAPQKGEEIVLAPARGRRADVERRCIPAVDHRAGIGMADLLRAERGCGRCGKPHSRPAPRRDRRRGSIAGRGRDPAGRGPA